MGPRPVVWFLCALLVGVTVLGVRRALSEHARDRARVKELESEIGRVREEVSSLRDQPAPVIYVDRREAPPVPQPAGPAPALSAVPSEMGSSAPRSRESAARNRAKFSAALDRRLRSEAVDSAWAGLTLSEIHDAVREKAAASRLIEATCAATLCRVVLEYPSPKEQRDADNQLGTVAPFEQGTHYVHDITTGGAPVTTLYLVRDGYDVADEAKEAQD